MNDRAENKPPEISELGCFKTPPENFKTFYDAVLELVGPQKVSISNPESEIYKLALDLINALLQKKIKAIGRSPAMYSVLHTFQLENPAFPFLSYVNDFYFITWDFWFQAEPALLIKSGTITTTITEPEGYGGYARIISKNRILWTDVHVDINEMLNFFNNNPRSTEKIKPESPKQAVLSTKTKNAICSRIIELALESNGVPVRKKDCEIAIRQEYNVSIYIFRAQWQQAREKRPDLPWSDAGRPKVIKD